MTIEEQQEKQKKVRAINDEWMGDPDNWKNGGWDTLMATEEPFYMHEPFAFKCDDGSESVPYWEEKRKIVFCNLNTYGDFLHLTDKYQKRVCYMNINPLIRSGPRWTMRDKTGKSPCESAWEFYDDASNRYYQRRLIAALEPDIFITTGDDGYKLLTHIYKHEGSAVPENYRYTGEELLLPKWPPEEPKCGFKRFGKTLFVSIQHPSQQNTRFDDTYIVDTVEKFAREAGSAD